MTMLQGGSMLLEFASSSLLRIRLVARSLAIAHCSAHAALLAAIVACSMLLPVAESSAQNMSAIGCCDALPEFRDGTATLAQVQDWVTRTWTDGYFRNESPGPAPAPIDLDQDGVADLLREIPGGGSGGAMHAAFLSTPSGYRFAGTFQGRVVPVSRAAGEPPRVVTSSRSGGGCWVVQLIELRAAGMYRLAQSSLRAGVDDHARAEDSRLYGAMFEVPVAQASAVRQVFAGPTPMEALLINVAAQVPELTLTGEVHEICGSVFGYYQAPGAAPDTAPPVAIGITTHNSLQEAANGIEASTRRSAWGPPTREETVNGQILYVWDANASHKAAIRARVGTRVISADSQQQLAALAMQAIRVLLPQIAAADGE